MHCLAWNISEKTAAAQRSTVIYISERKATFPTKKQKNIEKKICSNKQCMSDRKGLKVQQQQQQHTFDFLALPKDRSLIINKSKISEIFGCIVFMGVCVCGYNMFWFIPLRIIWKMAFGLIFGWRGDEKGKKLAAIAIENHCLEVKR